MKHFDNREEIGNMVYTFPDILFIPFDFSCDVPELTKGKNKNIAKYDGFCSNFSFLMHTVYIANVFIIQ